MKLSSSVVEKWIHMLLDAEEFLSKKLFRVWNLDIYILSDHKNKLQHWRDLSFKMHCSASKEHLNEVN